MAINYKKTSVEGYFSEKVCKIGKRETTEKEKKGGER